LQTKGKRGLAFFKKNSYNIIRKLKKKKNKKVGGKIYPSKLISFLKVSLKSHQKNSYLFCLYHAEADRWEFKSLIVLTKRKQIC
jgi:hypothetical protein